MSLGGAGGGTRQQEYLFLILIRFGFLTEVAP